MRIYAVFWSFPSQRGAIVCPIKSAVGWISLQMNSQMLNRLETAKETNVNLKTQVEELQENIKTEKLARAETVR